MAKLRRGALSRKISITRVHHHEKAPCSHRPRLRQQLLQWGLIGTQ
nr:MAG TPA: hypothetical protein [Caudoviricetes sp.]DAL45375.1 MAG TPA_asm: hypothetical protein [Caudoviricetes sp.]